MNRPNIAELYRRVAAGVAHEKTERRELVLSYPDLAARLTRLPWPFSEPDRWSGHIPPYLFAGRRNDSPQRAALVEICREAISRKYGDDIAARWLAAINSDPDAPTWSPHTAIEQDPHTAA